MSEAPSPAPWSTVAALPDHLLLAQTAQLARHEQALQILVLDHLREIEARRLHLTRGYGSLFDYVVHELGYTAAAAWRRIKAMRLCSQTEGARELLQDGSLNLSNAAQLQNLFERSDRSRGRPPGSDGTDGGPGGGPREDGASGEPAPAAPMRPGERDPAPVAGPVLDAAAREELVKQAAGKSTREVQQMLAEVDPELAQPSDRMRALAGGRWELKAAIDTECRHGLEKLQMLLSHQDPHLTLGALIARLVRDGLDRYDPARPRGTRGTGGRGSVSGERSASQPARRDTEVVERNVAHPNRSAVVRQGEVEQDDASSAAAVWDGVVSAQGSDVERQSEVEQGDAPSAAVQDGVPGPSAPKRPSEAEHGSASPATAPNSGGHTTSAPKRPSEAEHGSASPATASNSGVPGPSAPKRSSEAEHGSASPATASNSGVPGPSAPKRSSEAEHGTLSPATAPNSGGHMTSAAKRPSGAEHGSASPATAPNSGDHTTSAPKRHEQAEFGRTSRAAAGAGSGRADSPAKPYTEAEAGSTKSAVVHSSNGHTTSPAKQVAQDKDAHIEVAERLCGAAVPAPERRRETDHACGQPKAMHGNGGRAASPANRPGRADDDGAAGPRFDAGERGASRAPVRSHDRFMSSAAKRLAYAAGQGAVERSPALERHLAALHSVDASPGSRSRYIPVAVRRDVWRRDHGCCSYVDPHSGRRCGSRYRLEIDHVVPFALGGATEPSNLRVRCRAHHRLRHAPRHAHDASVPTEARRAPISVANDASRRAGT